MLTGDYIRGLVDGEGCFNVKVWRDKRPNCTFRVEVKFFIALRDDNYHLLEQLKEFFGCGRIKFARKAYDNRKAQWRYVVCRKDDLKKTIIPFFEKYPLIGVKRYDFELFKEAVEIWSQRQHLTLKGKNFPRLQKRLVDPNSKGLLRIKQIASEINTYRNSLESKKV